MMIIICSRIFVLFLGAIFFNFHLASLDSHASSSSHAAGIIESEKWHQGFWVARGHEDLTRMGVEMANEALRKSGSDLFFPRVRYGDSGKWSKNPLVKGNYATDFADHRMREHYAPDSYHGSWGSNPNLQILHFLRNYPRGNMPTMEETCQQARNLMVKNTLWAFTHFTDSEHFLYWIGHVLHTIQDSFSASHVHRPLRPQLDPVPTVLYRKIEDICTYGRRFSGACYHQKFDIKDRIWRKNLRCTFGNNRGFNCLKGRAKAAVRATAGYLLTVADLAKAQQEWRERDRKREMKLELGGLSKGEWESQWGALVDRRMHSYFTDQGNPLNGYFDCAIPLDVRLPSKVED